VPEYRAALKASAKKELLRLPDPIATRILAKIKGLAEDPRPHGCKKLAGGADEWRIRVGDYRAICTIDDELREVIVPGSRTGGKCMSKGVLAAAKIPPTPPSFKDSISLP
jgi:mRNA interferase RelE/StbE